MPLYAISMPGPFELMVVLVIVLILFGAGRLPQVFKSFGEGLKQFKDAQKDPDPVDVTPKEISVDKIPEAREIKEKV